MPEKTCYVCGDPATSDDHVPPKVFFPKPEEAGKDLRKQLITVPACHAHNGARSDDDTYAAIVLAFCSHSPYRPPEAFQERLHRALRRKNASLGRRLVTQFDMPALIGGERTSALRFERHRVQRVLIATGRGLLFHHTGERMQEPVLQWSRGTMLSTEGPPSAAALRVRDVLRVLFEDAEVHGENSEVVCWSVVPEFRAVQIILYQEWEFFVFDRDALRDAQAPSQTSADQK